MMSPNDPPHDVGTRHAMNSGLMTDIGKEASHTRSGSLHVETMPKSGQHRLGRGERVLPPTAGRRAGNFRNCNLHSAWAQYIQGANRVFDRQIDAS
jgi:hypothetical protein